MGSLSIIMDSKVVVVFVALIFATNAFNDFVPEGKELVYRYHGLIRTGSHLPISYASAFVLEGDLHMQNDKNSTFLHFRDLKYKLFNGKYDEFHEFDTKLLPMPKELDALQNTFKIIYTPDGITMGIAVEEKEPAFVINMKKGLASIMQIYNKPLRFDTEDVYSYHEKEQTLHGREKRYYTVMPGTEDKNWLIQKMAEPRSYINMYEHMSTNLKASRCEEHFDEPLTRDSNQDFVIAERDGHKVVENIESNGGIYYTPMEGESWAFHIYMNQTLDLTRIDTPKEPMKLTTEWLHPELDYYHGHFEGMQGVEDITHGRRSINMDLLMGKLDKMLYKTVEYLKEYHINMEFNFKGQSINEMLRIMVHLDEASLETITGKLLQKTTDDDHRALHIWYHMLPMTGSHATFMYMMKLIKSKQIKDPLALEMLQSMSRYVKEPTATLVEHMSDMLNWPEDLNINVRKAAVLAFGTMIQKAVFRNKLLTHKLQWPGHEDHETNFYLDKAFPPVEHYEKYIDMIGEKLKKSDTMQWKLVYISALHNTRMTHALKILMPIVKGKLFEDSPQSHSSTIFVQFMAIMSIGKLIPSMNEEMMFETFWPILNDQRMETSLRIAAYYQIMRSHPSFQRVINVFWAMEFETNPALYQFHYKYATAMSKSVNPCWQEHVAHLKQILRYTYKPEFRGMTGFYEMDFMDSTYDYGYQFGGMFIETPWEDQKIIKVKFGHNRDHLQFPISSVLLRVAGIKSSIIRDVALNLKDANKNLNFDKILNDLRGLMTNPDFKLEMAIMKNGVVTMWYHVCEDNIQDLKSIHDFFFGDKYSYIKKYFTIDYPLQHNQLIPTDMGFPAMFVAHVPMVHNYDYKITKEIVNKMITYQYDVHLNRYSHSRIGLKFYNPIVDIFQGVYRINSFDLVEPLHFDLSINPTQQSLKLSWKRHEDPEKDVIGYKSHGSTFVFVQDDMENERLRESSPDSLLDESMITLGDRYRHNKILREIDDSNTGYKMTNALIDSEMYGKNISIFNPYYMDHVTNAHHLGHVFIKFFHKMTRTFLLPNNYAGGFMTKLEPSKLHPVTNVDLNLRVAREYANGANILEPQSKYNVRATYSVNNNEKRTKTWDMNVNFDMNMGHDLTNLKMIVSRLVPGEDDWRLCMDGTRKQTDKGIEGTTFIAVSKSTEAKCNKEDNIMEINMMGELSEEQTDGRHMHHECQELMWSDLHEQNPFECYVARDSLRKWTYNIKMLEMPDEVKKGMRGMVEWLKVHYMKYLTTIHRIPEKKDSVEMVFRYPMMDDVVDVEIDGLDHEYKFGGISNLKLPTACLHLTQSRHFTRLFKLMHAMSWTRTCFVDHQNVWTVHDEDIEFVMPKEYTPYASLAEEPKDAILMKKLEGDLVAFKMVHGEHVLEIVPIHDKMYEVTIDGTKMPEGTYQSAHETVYVDWVKETGVISILCKRTGSHILFDGHHLHMESPNTMDLPKHGKCAEMSPELLSSRQ